MLVAIFVAVIYATVTGGALHGRRNAFAAPIVGLSLPSAASSVPSQDQTVLRPLAINKTLRAEQPVTAQQQQVVQQFVALNATPTAQPTDAAAAEDAVVRAASVQPTPEIPQYQVYQVQDGDTVTSIAAKFGVETQYIEANNAEIQNADFLTIGQSLIIPAGNGILHEVQYGETLSDIASEYSVTVADITGFAGNNISSPDNIHELQMVYVPGATPPAPPAAPVAQSNPTATTDTASPAAAAAPTPAPPVGDGNTASPGGYPGKGLIWPVYGPISSCYCPWHPLGIDIDGYNLAGAPIRAATSGTVTLAGGDACCSYGLHVIIMSPTGIETLYGHLSSIAVTQGETVSQGQTLGIIGDTGYSTGTHLHFEVIDNGVRENPLDYLPGPVICEAGQRCNR